MSFIDTFRAWWTFKQNRGRRGEKGLYLLDAASLGSRRKGGGRRSPAEQLQTLQRLAGFARKEKIKVSVLLEGKPLREAAHGGAYQGLTVYYAARAADTPDLALKILKDELRRRPVTVITSDRRLEERVLGAGAKTMRASTFRKALDSVVGSGQERSRQRPSGGEGGKKRPPRRRRPPRRDTPPAEEKPDQAVRELLDLIE